MPRVYVLDTETATVRGMLMGSRLVQVAVRFFGCNSKARVPRGKVFQAVVCQNGLPIPPSSTRLYHKLTDEDVADAQSERHVLMQLKSFLGNHRIIIVAHNADFDRRVIEYAFYRNNIAIPLEWEWACSLKCMRKRFPHLRVPGSTSYSLVKLHEMFCPEAEDFQAHTAMGDVNALCEVMRAAGIGEDIVDGVTEDWSVGPNRDYGARLLKKRIYECEKFLTDAGVPPADKATVPSLDVLMRFELALHNREIFDDNVTLDIMSNVFQIQASRLLSWGFPFVVYNHDSNTWVFRDLSTPQYISSTEWAAVFASTCREDMDKFREYVKGVCANPKHQQMIHGMVRLMRGM